jgi:hypothetical protein
VVHVRPPPIQVPLCEHPLDGGPLAHVLEVPEQTTKPAVVGLAHEAAREELRISPPIVGVTAGKHDEGSPDVRLTYRFGPPEPYPEEGVFASGIENGPAQFALKHSSNSLGEISRMPPIWNAPAL